ncbi:MAG: Slp family lipoprotein [Nitrospiraceae bacterium]
MPDNTCRGKSIRQWTYVAALVTALLSSGCASMYGGPDEVVNRALTPELRQQIDRTVTFADVREATDRVVGRTVMLDGLVLSAKRAADRTEIEMLQLPREEGRPPTRDRTQSQGRFLAIHPQFIDPARFEPGLVMTVVGEVQGAETRALDEGEYRYPVLALKQLVTWEVRDAPAAPQYAGGAMRPFASEHHWWGPTSYYFGPFGPYPSAPYTNPAACPFCYYPPGSSMRSSPMAPFPR